ELDAAGGLDRDVVDGGGSRRGTADMEGAHGQLRTGLADRLRGDDTDRFAVIDEVAATEVTTVALGADTEAAVAAHGRAHLDRLHTSQFQLVHPLFVEQGVAGD